MKINTAALFFLVSIFSTTLFFGQNQTPFAAQEKMYLKGNSVLIGNTILGKHPQYAFDEVKILNDQVPLIFADIDEDESTFSSSKASFTLPDSAREIKYAGLYWGGLYPAQSSSKRKGRRKMKYTYLGERNPNIQEIKLKINEDDYQDIIGQVIFDSKAEGPFAKESPYACFLDITPQMKNKKGEVNITVANIRATTGFIEGGAAAGWLVYLVYEDNTAAPKYFTSYTGFKEVSKDEVEVVFEDLQPKNENTTTSKILMATLEGDTRIKGDACAIYSDTKELFTPLTTEGRPSNNFFNSTVTVGHDIKTTRTPASKNTLGFDLLKMNIPDSTFTANTTDATIRLSTRQDRFYTFFLAFETEIEETVLEAQTLVIAENQESEAIVLEEKPKSITNPFVVNTPITKNENTPTVTKPTVTEITGPPPVFTSPAPVVVNPSTTSPKITNTQVAESNNTLDTNNQGQTPGNTEAISEKEKKIMALETIENRPSVSSSGMISGYYLVTNVFEDKTNATRWKQRLNQEGYNARTFINQENQTTYVYIESSKIPEEMQLRKEVVRQISHLAKTWVCRVNL